MREVLCVCKPVRREKDDQIRRVSYCGWKRAMWVSVVHTREKRPVRCCQNSLKIHSRKGAVHHYAECRGSSKGLFWELNPGPLAP
eukprot:4868102-Amphidinium_carterae.1